MPLCGIKRFDKLPGRVALIDVDALRAMLIVNRNDRKKILQFLNRAVSFEHQMEGLSAAERAKFYLKSLA